MEAPGGQDINGFHDVDKSDGNYCASDRQDEGDALGGARYKQANSPKTNK